MSANKPRVIKTLLLSTILILILASTSNAATCANTEMIPNTAHNIKLAEKSIACLVNKERTKRHLKALKTSKELYKSSRFQGQDMDKLGYFAHDRPNRPLDFLKRILRFGYRRNANSVSVGENLLATSTEAATPKEIVSLWMHSPGHRRNILTKKWRHQGVYILQTSREKGDYEDWGDYVIAVNQFGWRK